MNNVTQLQTAAPTPRHMIAPTDAKSADILELGTFREFRAQRVNAPTYSARSWFGAATDAPITADDVRAALKEGRLVMHYQPQYDMRTGKTVAAEALVRLNDIDGRLIYPDRFIDMVERSDLIVPLGRAVISQVCADLASSRAQGCTIRRMAINLAARQLDLDTKLPEFIDQELMRYGLQYDDLEFELTERQNLAPNCPGIAQLDALDQRGARIVLDDFGIGYSSVIYLTKLPISAFKLDRELVSRLPGDHTTRTVLESLLALATKLGLEVIAEGIETAEQHEFLDRTGCPYGQGFGYAKPMGIDDLQTFIVENGDLH